MSRKDRSVIPDATRSRSGIQKTFVCPGFSAAGGLRDFQNDEIHAPDQRLVTCTTMLAKRKGRASYGPYPFPYSLPSLYRLIRVLLIISLIVNREKWWILYIHLHTYKWRIWIKSIHFGDPGQGEKKYGMDPER